MKVFFPSVKLWRRLFTGSAANRSKYGTINRSVSPVIVCESLDTGIILSSAAVLKSYVSVSYFFSHMNIKAIK